MKKDEKFPVAEVLSRGRENATSRETLKNYFSFSDRELYAEIERERLNGKCILAKKNDGGGYYLPASQTERDEYLEVLLSLINSHRSVYDAIKKAPME